MTGLNTTITVAGSVPHVIVSPVAQQGPTGADGLPGAGIPEVFVDGAPATLNFVPNGDGTYGIEVTL